MYGKFADKISYKESLCIKIVKDTLCTSSLSRHNKIHTNRKLSIKLTTNNNNKPNHAAKCNVFSFTICLINCYRSSEIQFKNQKRNEGMTEIFNAINFFGKRTISFLFCSSHTYPLPRYICTRTHHNTLMWRSVFNRKIPQFFFAYSPVSRRNNTRINVYVLSSKNLTLK